MNNQAFGILEFDSLRALLRRGAQTDDGGARIDALAPIADPDELRRSLRVVAECAELRQRGGRLSFDGIADTRDSRSRLRIEGTALDPLAILDLARLCDRAMDARAAILVEREAFPTLFEIVAALTSELNKLAARLHKKILPSGELDDRASPQLATIRHEIARARSRITRSLENLMRRSSDAIQEELVTIRNDRFVIPVRSDHQSRIKGVAHGSSSSGATIFVEPLETIEANNELQTLRETEQREIAEILFALSEELRRELPAIEQAAHAITELDFVNAKVGFAETFNCVVPEIAGSADVPSALSAEGVNGNSKREENTLEFIDARHPLLEESLRASGATVVPVSFKLDSEHSVMVISGANAGGKTVVLKTAGLLSLMALSGLPVPAKRASVPFYRSILADIGDHQSLAANLSTFTSHVANIGKMIELCEAAESADVLPAAGSALVLLDEVGTGTDPEEGSALGVAVVDHFRYCGAHVLATTHYSGLKMFAANEPGVLNASVEFDEQTLRPTYRLLVGLAGSSSGLEIAQRFGIPAEVISKASEQVKQSTRDAVEYLRRIKREAEEIQSLRQALEEERAAVAEKFSSLEAEAAKRESERQAEFERALSRAIKEFEERSREFAARIEDRASRLKVDREAARRAAELKREAQRVALVPSKPEEGPRRSSSQRSAPELRGVRVIRDGQLVSDLSAEPDKSKPNHERGADPGRQDIRGPQRDLKVGDRVRLLSFGSVGIVNHIKDDEAEVRVGSLRMREKLENLELVFEVSTSGSGASDRLDEVSAPTRRGSGRVKPSLESLRKKAATTELHLHSNSGGHDISTSAELNLIGKTTDEAVDLTDKFLDQAFLNGLSELRIIHGHGTGALRRAIADLLKEHPHVARFAAAAQDHGGAGATVVELRQ